MSEYTPYQQRVVDEQTALGEKVVALAAFFDGEVFQTLSNYEQQLLVMQFNNMTAYGLVLQMRIENFNKEMS